MTRAEFDSLLERFRRANAPGAGRPHARGGADRLLMALLWLCVYPTYEVLGYFFGLHKRNAQLNVRSVLAVLDSLDDFPKGRPGPTARSCARPRR